MFIEFLGTKGEIDQGSLRRALQSSLLVVRRGRRVMIDCGQDWLGSFDRIRPDAIVLTHAHADHAFGLQNGAPCPVYAMADAHKSISSYPIDKRVTIEPRKPWLVEGLKFEAFEIEHSIRNPAVSYRVTADGTSFHYAPDVVRISDLAAALKNVGLYIGDGASLDRNLIRKTGDRQCGHASMRTQLGWCEELGVRWAIFTHCGSEIIDGDGRSTARRLREFGREHGVRATFAHDGLQMAVPVKA